jgi:hypothetical protein
MGKQFIVKKLVESYEIQKSYDEKNYFEAVVKCRTFLEGWILEYIYAIMYPPSEKASTENREFIESRFTTMYVQLNWLIKFGHIRQIDFDNLDNIRKFCDEVIRKNDVFKVVELPELDQYIKATVYYCDYFKNLIRQLIEKATGQKITL